MRNEYSRNGNTVSMKTVQESIKAGTATPELLDTAIEGIKHREARAKEIDKDKIQINVLQQVEEKACDLANIKGLTENDRIAARLLVYQSLDYSSRSRVDTTLFKKVKEVNLEVLKKLTDKEYSYLIRMALSCKSDSKYPTSETGITLYKVAEAAGVDVKAIEKDQQEKATARGERVKLRVKDLGVSKFYLVTCKHVFTNISAEDVIILTRFGLAVRLPEKLVFVNEGDDSVDLAVIQISGLRLDE